MTYCKDRHLVVKYLSRQHNKYQNDESMAIGDFRVNFAAREKLDDVTGVSFYMYHPIVQLIDKKNKTNVFH